MDIIIKSMLSILLICAGYSSARTASEVKNQEDELEISLLKKPKSTIKRAEPAVPLFRKTAEKIKQELAAQKGRLIKKTNNELVKPVVIEKNVGKKFVIELPVNLANGFSWYWMVNDPLKERPVELIKKEFVAQNTGLLGGEGKVRFTFKAMKVGKTSVILYKKRLFEKNSVEDIRYYDVTVHYKRHLIKCITQA